MTKSNQSFFFPQLSRLAKNENTAPSEALPQSISQAALLNGAVHEIAI